MKDYRTRLAEALKQESARSAWRRGVIAYALEIVQSLPEQPPRNRGDLMEALLNGAEDWRQYAEAGNSLVYDCDIAERLCTPSELRRARGGDLPPNGLETWLDVQERALAEAASVVLRRYRREIGYPDTDA